MIRYAEQVEMYSGVVHIKPSSVESSAVAAEPSSVEWYGKTHLVMFGEYIPILPWIPGLKSLVPPSMGLNTGPGPSRMTIGDTIVAPNICVETAVERVCVNQMRALRSDGPLPDVLVTVTNDGWFDDSSVVDHHLRCAQLVAVGCRRPILSSANNGPTAWIDSSGQIVDQLDTGENGAVIAKPIRDPRTSPYVRIGDWPATGCAMFCLVIPFVARRKKIASNT